MSEPEEEFKYPKNIQDILDRIKVDRKLENKKFLKSIPKSLLKGLLWVLGISSIFLYAGFTGAIFRSEVPFWWWKFNSANSNFFLGVILFIIYLIFYITLFLIFYPICRLIFLLGGLKGNDKNKNKAWVISIFFGIITMLFHNEIISAQRDIFTSGWIGLFKLLIFGISIFFAVNLLCNDDLDNKKL